jgi:RNA polymerase sigma-70 factor (ECF subfamily)
VSDFNHPDRLAAERRWIAAVRHGDRAAFAELYRAFAGAVYAQVLMPRLGDAAAAEDALAETFRAALEHLGEYRDEGISIWFWLARIATNKANDQQRARARGTRALASAETLLAPLRGGLDPTAELHGFLDGPAVRAQIDRVLAQINPRYRRALELRFLEGRGRSECAQLLEVRVASFDVLLLRALRAFAAQWTASLLAKEAV